MINIALLFVIVGLAITVAVKNSETRKVKKYYRKKVNSLERENTILHQEFEKAKNFINKMTQEK